MDKKKNKPTFGRKRQEEGREKHPVKKAGSTGGQPVRSKQAKRKGNRKNIQQKGKVKLPQEGIKKEGYPHCHSGIASSFGCDCILSWKPIPDGG